MSPYDRKLDEVKATMGHTIQMLQCWMHEVPFSDAVTRKTQHAYKLPACPYSIDTTVAHIHYLDKCEDPGHGPDSDCELCRHACHAA